MLGSAPPANLVLGTLADVGDVANANPVFLPMDVILRNTAGLLAPATGPKLCYWLSRVWWGGGVRLVGRHRREVEMGLMMATGMLAVADGGTFDERALTRNASTRISANLAWSILQAADASQGVAETLQAIVVRGWGRCVPVEDVLLNLRRADVAIPKQLW